MATTISATAQPQESLVPTFTATIGGVEQLCADARFLHAYLQSARHFTDWMNDRLQKYGFEEGSDYELISEKPEIKAQGGFSQNHEKPSKGGRPAKDYRISLDMAKELSMVENNARGREARRYFIAMERKALGLAQTVAPVSAPPQPQPAPPTAREKLNAADMQHIKHIVWRASHNFYMDESANQGIWYDLRQVTNNPAPNAYSVDHIPVLAAELRRVLTISHQVRQITHHIEAQAIKRIFRKGEVAEKVLAHLAAEAERSVQQLQDQVKEFPAWLEVEILRFTERKPALYGHACTQEQPDFFRAFYPD